MTTLEGKYYDGRRPIAQSAAIDFSDREATVTAGTMSWRGSIDALKVSPRTGSAERFIDLPDGGQLQCPDQPFLDVLPQSSPSEGPVAWLEARWGVALSGVALVLSILFAGYFYGLPAAAKRIAGRIPIATEAAIGRQALDWFDAQGWFKPSNLDETAQQNIRRGFDGLRSGLPLGDFCQLEFRASRAFGANAFALPGGTIVITDEMVLTADSREEVLAVLAHEIGHVELRHAMRSVLQDSAIAVAAAAITSDAASLSAAVAGMPVLLARTKYSREFESTADEYAFSLMKRKGYSPDAFASIMERLAAKEARAGGFAYISTHPVTEERVQRARDAAKEK